MKFYFEIEDDIFEDEFGVDFKNAVKLASIDSIAETVFSGVVGDSYYAECGAMVKQIIKDYTPAIIERVVERVADNISRKRAIVEMTPKASELAAADKDNVAYFESMIDKAIARRFGK